MDLKEFIRRADACASAETLWLLSRDTLAARAVERISYHLYGGVDGRSEISIRTEGFPEDWICQYLEEKLYRVDPITEFSRAATRPFFWSELSHAKHLSEAQAHFMQVLARQKLGEGLAIHVRGPQFRDGYVGLGFGAETPNMTPGDILELQVIAQTAHIRYCELTADQLLQRRDLSPREREVLSWIAKGKSNAVIADILQVSPHTVDTLVKRIFDKLGVSNRVMAAMIGMGSGVLHRGDLS